MNYIDWITSRQAILEIEKVWPDSHASKELANAAMKAGFESRARLAVFSSPQGSLEKREPDFEIPQEWWGLGGPSDEGGRIQVLNLQKCEGWAKIGSPSRRVDLFGICFRLKDLVAHFGIETPKGDRAPSVKTARPPSEDKILEMADQMKGRGMDGRTIASTMRFEPGFENVATTDVRELIRGRWKPSGRPKQKGA